MAKKGKKSTKIKVKRKTWFKLFAPTIFGKKEIGETYLTSADKAIGRIMGVNLRNLTGSIRDQNVYITLKIDNLKAQQLHTTLAGYELVPFYIKRLIRKRYSRIDNVYKLTTKDGQEVVVKTLIIALYRNKRSTGAALQVQSKELFTEVVSAFTFSDLVSRLAAHKIQGDIKKKLNSTYPVKDFTVRSFKLANLSGELENTVEDLTSSDEIEIPVEKSSETEGVEKSVVENPIEKVAQETEEVEEVKEETTEEVKEDSISVAE